MKQLTIEERHEVYKLALYKYTHQEIIRTSPYLCDCIEYATKDILGYKITANHFPEFMKFEKGTFTWWELHDRQSRIDCLTKCIELTAPKP